MSSDVEQLVVLSVNFRDHATADREQLGAGLMAVHPLRERCLVRTCHRVELVAVAGESPVPRPDGARVFRGRDAVERVFRVAGGLDSAVLAEEQILGQIREAYATALARGETGPLLNELFRRAVRFGKRVRSLAQPVADHSLADRAARWALERAGAHGSHPRTALVIGTGEMGRLLAARFASAGFRCTIASRSLERASGLAAKLPARPHLAHGVAALDEIGPALGTHAIVAMALRRPVPVLSEADVSRCAAAAVVDLSSPPAISPASAAALGDRLLDLDGVGQTEALSALSPRAEREVREQLAAERDRYVAWLADHRNGSEIARLRRDAEEVRARHLAQLKGRVALSESDLAAVERMTASLVGELVHLRTVEARERLMESRGG